MKYWISLLLSIFTEALLRPRNFDSIRHDNFRRLWSLNFKKSAWLVHTDTQSITASLLVNGELEASSNSNVLLIEDCNQATSFDYIFSDNLFIWGDHGLSSQKVPGSINFYSNKTRSWRFDIRDSASINSLVVDWIGKNVYWSDENRNVVNVCSIDGGSCKPIIVEDFRIVKNAQVLHIDSPRNRLYFDNDAKIESVSLDGTNRRVLIGDGAQTKDGRDLAGHVLMGMTVDVDKGRVFFGSQKDRNNDIKVISVEGTDITRVYTRIDHPDPMLIFNSTVFWQDESGEELFSLPFPHPIGAEPKPYNVRQPINILIISPLLQPDLNDPCINSHCSNLCLRTEIEPYFTCACPTGITFKMIEDKRSTTECNQHPEHVMVLAQTDDLRLISLDTPDRQSIKLIDYNEKPGTNDQLPTDQKHCLAVAIDPINQKIYYTTSYIKIPKKGVTINTCSIDGSNNEIIMSGGLAEVQGMALDFINQILYWTDCALGHIEMASLSCKCDLPGCRGDICRKIIVELDIEDRPRAIVVGGGYIFWSDWSRNPRIERAFQDGTGRKAIVEDKILWPNGLTLSPDHKTLFFLEAHEGKKKIEQINIDGSGRKVIFSMDSKKWNYVVYWAINNFKNKLYMWGANEAILSLEQNPDGDGEWVEEDFSPLKNGYMIATADLTQELKVKQSSCAYMTFPKPVGNPSCGCPDGFDNMIIRNSVTCSAPKPEIMYITLNTTQDMINILQLASPASRRQLISIQQTINPPSVDYHYKLGLIYYFETENDITTLYKTGLQSMSRLTDGKARAMVTNVGLKGAVKLAVDWIGDSIYWTNNELGRIEQIGIDGRNRRTVTTDCGTPHAIKVDPVAGYIFWSDWKYRDNTLVRSDMSGSNSIALLKASKGPCGDRISAITLDYENHLVYLIDLDTNVIFEIGYNHDFNERPKAFVCKGENGQSKDNCLRSISAVHQRFISALSFYGKKLYWVEEEDQRSTLKSIEIGKSEVTIANDMRPIEEIVVIAPQTGWGYCLVEKQIPTAQRKKCPGVCIAEPISEPHQYASSCVCPTHHQMLKDLIQGQICQAPKNFLLYAQSRQVSRLMLEIINHDNFEEIGGADQVLSIHGISKAKAISWDTFSRRFYWVDSQKHKIYSMEEEGDKRVALLDGKISARDIAIYVIGELIFWTSYESAEICYTHLTPDGKGRDKTCLRSQPNVVPDRIAIHQQSGTIIYSNNCTNVVCK